MLISVARVKTVRKQQGASLLEVMIGLFVLAIGMLGFMGLLTSSLTMNQRAYTSSQATFLAEEIFDRARANREVLTSYGITLATTPAGTSTIVPKCNAAACTEAQLAAWDLAEWMETLQQALPGGDAAIVIDTTVTPPQMQVTIQYTLKQGSNETGSAALLGQLGTFQMATEI